MAGIARDAAALVAALLLFHYFTRGELFGRGRWPRPTTRTAYLARLTLRPALIFGGGGLLLLALLGDLDASGAVPAPLAPARAAVVRWTGAGLAVSTLVWSALVGMLIGALLTRLLAGRGQRDFFGRTDAVMPRRARELPWGAAMSVSAGISEELFFRLLVPLCAARLTGSAWVGLALGVVLFALAHRYQGWRGMIATGVVAAILTAAYLIADSLWVAMLLHVALDLNALVLRPVLAGRVSSSAATRS